MLMAVYIYIYITVKSKRKEEYLLITSPSNIGAKEELEATQELA